MEVCNNRGEVGRIYTGRSLLIFSDPMTYEEHSFLGEPCGAGEQFVDLEVLHTAGELGRSVSIEMDKTMSPRLSDERSIMLETKIGFMLCGVIKVSDTFHDVYYAPSANVFL